MNYEQVDQMEYALTQDVKRGLRTEGEADAIVEQMIADEAREVRIHKRNFDAIALDLGLTSLDDLMKGV